MPRQISRSAILISLFTFGFLFYYLLFRWATFSFRYSDTAHYFYSAYQLTQGKILYKDVFFTNFPLFAYISVIYFYLTGGSQPAFYFTSAIETVILAFGIYFVARKLSSQTWLAFAAAAVFFSAFLVQHISTFQNGIGPPALFSLLAYYFYTQKKSVPAGIFSALTLLTKAYFIPVIAALGVMYLYNVYRREIKYSGLIKFILGGLVTSAAVLIPTYLISGTALFTDLFGYALHRPAVSLLAPFAWFVRDNPLLFLLFLFNILNFRRQIYFSLVGIFFILFLFFYPSIYYLYYYMLVPFLALGVLEVYRRFPVRPLVFVGLLTPFLIYSVWWYAVSGFPSDRVNTFPEMLDIIQANKPDYLFGEGSVVPSLAYEAHIPLLKNRVITYEEFFTSGWMDKEEYTDSIVSSRTLVITPANYDSLTGKYNFSSEIFDRAKMEKYCRVIRAFPNAGNPAVNAILVLKCY